MARQSFLTPLILLLQKRFVRPAEPSLDGMEGPHDLHGRVLVIGFGRVGQIASQGLLARGTGIVIIDNDPEAIRAAEQWGFRVYYGDGTRTDVLHAAGAEHADLLLVCIDDAQAVTRIAETAKAAFPRAGLVVRAWDREHAVALMKSGADVVVRETFDSAVRMGREALLRLGSSEEQANEIIDDLRRRDAERLTLEIAGGLFAGRDLLFRNTELRVANRRVIASGRTSPR